MGSARFEGSGEGVATRQHPPVVALRKISKTFGGVRALQDVDLTIRRGEIHGLLGENGSGKSTLIKILSGYHAADGGTISLGGQRVQLPVRRARKLGLEFVHQDLGLIPELTVAENVALYDLADGTAPLLLSTRSLVSRVRAI